MWTSPRPDETMRALIAALFLCAAPAAAQSPWGDTADDLPPPTAADQAKYRLGPGDALQIRVYGEPDLSGAFPISDIGEMDYPLLGTLTVTGMTANEVSAMLQRRLGQGFLVEPSVTAALASYQSQAVQVLGAVTAPGRYYLRGNTTVLQLLSEAGGVKLEGVDEVRITHGGEGGKVTVLSYERLLANGEGNISLTDGDVVFVPERLITVMGQVNSPGEVAFRKGMTVATGLAAAGGALATANLGRVYILRGEERIRVNMRKIINGRAADVPLEAGDRLLVKESIF